MSVESTSSHEVFISYSSKDKKWADAACAALESRRIRCWIAPRDITPGVEWGAALIGAIDACKVMVLIFSGHADASSQVRREVERVISKGRPVLPLRIAEVRPSGAMEYALSNTHWLDAMTPPVERHLRSLADAVGRLLDADGAGEDTRSAIGDTRAPTGPGRRGYLVTGGIALGVVMLFAGAFAMFGGWAKTSAGAPSQPGTRVTRPMSDEERWQGVWEVIYLRDSNNALHSQEDLVKRKTVWTIGGNRWEFNRITDSGMSVGRGAIVLRTTSEGKFFDVRWDNSKPPEQIMRGMYRFEGEILSVCFRGADPSKKAGHARPRTFDETDSVRYRLQRVVPPTNSP